MIDRSDHLAEGSLADHLQDLVAVTDVVVHDLYGRSRTALVMKTYFADN